MVTSEIQSPISSEVQDSAKEPAIRKPYYNHSDDHISLLTRLIKIAQNKFGMKPHYPKTGALSERPYYKVSRPTSTEDTSQA